MEVSITPEEIAQDSMSPENVKQAITAIKEDGFVILNNAVKLKHLDTLRDKMMEDSQKLIAAEKWGGAGRMKGHLQQAPPPFAPYIFKDIVNNPFIIQVTKGVLGEGVFNSFYDGNTNTPGSVEQPLHRDMAHLWPEWEVAHPASSLVANIALVEVTEEMGSIELWPGSHLDTSDLKANNGQAVAERRKTAPPIRGNTKKGSVLIRDMRLWHRGVPNQSDQIRHMIAMVHNIRWRQRPKTLHYLKGCEDAFANSELDHNATFVDEPFDYLFGEYVSP